MQSKLRSQIHLALIGLALFFFSPVAIARPLFAPEPVLGLRLDPGRLYDGTDLHKRDLSRLADHVADDIVHFGFNTAFLYAYSPVFGSYGRLKYPLTHQEPVLGRGGFIELFLKSAQKRSLRVVLCLPFTEFKSVWLKKPKWRFVASDLVRTNALHSPDLTESYRLFPGNSGFRAWYRGFLTQVIRTWPEASAIEAVEPTLDPNWQGLIDRSLEPLLKKTPSPSKPNDEGTRIRLRTRALVEHLALFSTTAHLQGRPAHFVQTWPSDPLGRLLSLGELRKGPGLDLSAIRSLPIQERPDVFNIELIWQQWKSTFGSELFHPSWTKAALGQAEAQLQGGLPLLVHIELTPFSGPHGKFRPTLAETLSLLKELRSAGVGVDVYDYNQWRQWVDGAQNHLPPNSKL